MAERVIVTGGRNYDNMEKVREVLSSLEIQDLAQGGASGADRLAALYCNESGVPCTTYSALWSTYGRSAGPRRNVEMLKDFQPTLVVAFQGGRGTAHMVSIAKKAGIKVLEVTDA